MDLYKYFYNLPGNEEHRVKMIIATDAAEYFFGLNSLCGVITLCFVVV